MDPLIPPDYELFDVTVTVEATAECRRLVMAKDRIHAMRLAERHTSFDILDLDMDSPQAGRTVAITPEYAEEQNDLDDDALIDWPLNSRRDVEVSCRELLDLLLEVDTERAERLRLHRIEANNGQLALLVVA
jgi:hypothetical protein